jgi:hypothetical protein
MDRQDIQDFLRRFFILFILPIHVILRAGRAALALRQPADFQISNSRKDLALVMAVLW